MRTQTLLLIVVGLLAGCSTPPPAATTPTPTAPAPATAISTPVSATATLAGTPTARLPTATPTSQVEQLTTLMQNLAAADEFSGAVLVAQDGTPIFTQAYGLADREANVPNRVDTKFNLASLTKMFTAVAIAQLAEHGKLSFDDPIRTHLPDYPNPEVADRVTIHHLLTHTSGLGDFINDTFWAAKDDLRTVADHLPLFAAKPLAFPPGERWRYSGAGYIVLGAIIEQVSGQSYFDYVQAHIFEAAGMTNTGFYERNQAVANLAIGYLGPTHVAANTSRLPIKGNPAGGSYSTVADLLKFAQALRSHQLLRPDMTERVLRGKVDVPDAPGGAQYAYGFLNLWANGTRIVGHSGGFYGVSARFDMYLNQGYTVIVLANYDPPTADEVGDRLREILLHD